VLPSKPFTKKWKSRLSVYTATHINVLLYSGMLKLPDEAAGSLLSRVAAWKEDGFKTFHILRTMCRECFSMEIRVVPEKAVEEKELLGFLCRHCEAGETAECVGDEMLFQRM